MNRTERLPLGEKNMNRWALLLGDEVISIHMKSDNSEPDINRRTAHEYALERVPDNVRVGMMCREDGTFSFDRGARRWRRQRSLLPTHGSLDCRA